MNFDDGRLPPSRPHTLTPRCPGTRFYMTIRRGLTINSLDDIATNVMCRWTLTMEDPLPPHEVSRRQVQEPRDPRGDPSTTPARPTLPYTCQTCFMTALTRPIYRPGEILRDKLITALVNSGFCAFIKYSLSARIYGPINRRPACPSLPILVVGQRRQGVRS